MLHVFHIPISIIIVLSFDDDDDDDDDDHPPITQIFVSVSDDPPHLPRLYCLGQWRCIKCYYFSHSIYVALWHLKV